MVVYCRHAHRMAHLSNTYNTQFVQEDGVKDVVAGGINYLDKRTEFWRQQKPIYARVNEQKMKTTKKPLRWVLARQTCALARALALTSPACLSPPSPCFVQHHIEEEHVQGQCQGCSPHARGD